jgi:hypothetical protein
MDGLYSTRNGGGADWLLTQFEIDKASEVFPCPDDPAVRVAWILTLQCRQGVQCVSCAPLQERRESPDGTVSFFFEETEALPAYCLGFCVFPVGSFCVDEATMHNAPLTPALPTRLFRPSKTAAPSSSIIRTLHESIALFEEFLGVAFPCTGKVDVVIAPCMTLGGMENHSLVFLNARLVQSKTEPGTDLVETIVHEVCHHWIGNRFGFPFAIKEGVCLVLEKWFGDLLSKRPPRRLRAIGGDEASELAVLLSYQAEQQLRAETYQRAVVAMTALAAALGFDGFVTKIRQLLRDGPSSQSPYITAEEFFDFMRR